ncbi:hypothetical protein ACTA71_011957 [Dictyostelium dimigraforme]
MKYFFKTFIILIVTFILITNADQDEIISTPPGYYDLKRIKRYPHYSTIQSNNISPTDAYLYYPDICAGAIPSNENDSIVNEFFTFPGSNNQDFNKLLVTKGSNLTLNELFFTDKEESFFIFTLCVEGSLYISEREYHLVLHSLVILPGGSVTIRRGLLFYDIQDLKDQVMTFDHPIDPLGYFPGILSLGGSLTLIGDQPLIYSTQVLSNGSLRISPPFPKKVRDNYVVYYKIKMFTDLYPFGLECSFTLDESKTIVTIGSCPSKPLLGNEKIMKVIFISNGVNYMNAGISTRSRVLPINKQNSASIFITGDTKVYIENYFINSEGRTLNEEYDDTKLIFSPDNRTQVTDIIMGGNQRYRNSLYIEFSNSVIIKNSSIFDKEQKRSPIVFFASNVEFSSNIVSSYSGSSLIAQFGTENIQSKNNHYFLVPYSKSLRPLNNSMDYGYEGNGFYSLSPNCKSENDTFIGHLNIFKFNFIANRSNVTGFDRDCYAPCFKDSVSVLSSVQHPVDFYLINPKYFKLVNNPIPNSSKFNLFIANSNGNQPDTFYTINRLAAIGPIIVNLDNNVLILKDFITMDNFKIDGSVNRLDIINSTIESVAGKDIFKNLSSLSTNIQGSYFYTPSSDGIQQLQNQIYGSAIAPYYYSNPITLNRIKIVSIYPNSPLQVISGLAFNIVIQFQLLYAFQDSISCIFTSDNDSIQNRTMDFNVITGRCVYPVTVAPNKEGSANVRVKIKNSQSSDYLYIIDFPLITVLKTYTFYSGWSMANSNLKFMVGGSLFQSGCQVKIDGNCTISDNISYATELPNVTSSDELNSLFSSGVTSLSYNEPVTITTSIDSNSTISQIQLYFIHLPIDQQTSPLSVYIENQPVYLLEPLQGNQGPTFKNITFKYENINSLKKINVAFKTRGDIYLTSMAIYSSNIVFIPPQIMPDPIVITERSVNENTNRLLSVVLPICSVVVVVSSVIFGRLFYLRKFKKSKPTAPDIENEMVTIEPIETSNPNTEENQESTVIVIPPQPKNEPNQKPQKKKKRSKPKITPYTLISPLPQLEITSPEAIDPIIDEIEAPLDENIEINSNEPIASDPVDTQQHQVESDPPQLLVLPSSSSSALPSSPPPPPPPPPIPSITSISQKTLELPIFNSFRTSSYMFNLKQSALIESSDPNNPLRFNRDVLDFNLQGLKATLFEQYTEFLLITNISNSTISAKMILPRDSKTGIIEADCYHFKLEPNSGKVVKISLMLNCTTKFFEKVVVQFNTEENSELMHSFLYVQVESELSTRFDANDLEYHNLIAKSSNSFVYKGLYKRTTVVIKTTSVNNKSKFAKDSIYNEIRILAKLRNKNVVSFFGCGIETGRIWVVMEYAQFGSLGSLIHDKGFKFSFLQKLRFMMDTAKGCLFLHASDIIHRDLKLDNLLLFNLEVEQDFCVKVSDFGNSKELCGENNSICPTVKGTTAYLSNEVLTESSYSKASDVYAFGILLYEIMTEKIPFEEEDLNQLSMIEFICEGRRPSIGLGSLDNNIRDLIQNCWNQDASKRPTFVKVFNILNQIFQIKQVEQQKKLLQSKQSFNWKEYYNRKNIK